MNVLYVYAHPEPKSFNAKLRDLALEVLAEQGHEVVLSDLHAMNFEAVHSRQDFTTERDADAFRYGREQSFAAKNAGFARDVKGKIDKLRACDMLIMQFPLWWFSVPAILKGWIDRTYAVGAISDHEHFYDRGYLVGKRAMQAVTMGAAETDMRGDGFHGDVLVNLWPIHNGCLYYIGMEVLPPLRRLGRHVRRGDDAGVDRAAVLSQPLRLRAGQPAETRNYRPDHRPTQSALKRGPAPARPCAPRCEASPRINYILF